MTTRPSPGLSVLLADGGDDDDEDDGVNGRLHSVSITRFELDHRARHGSTSLVVLDHPAPKQNNHLQQWHRHFDHIVHRERGCKVKLLGSRQLFPFVATGQFCPTLVGQNLRGKKPRPVVDQGHEIGGKDASGKNFHLLAQSCPKPRSAMGIRVKSTSECSLLLLL